MYAHPGAQTGEKADDKKPNKYAIKPQKKLESKFQAAQEAKKQNEAVRISDFVLPFAHLWFSRMFCSSSKQTRCSVVSRSVSLHLIL